VVKGVGKNFSAIEESIDDLFLPALFSDTLEAGDTRRSL
jgi:hypothetical protein